MKFFIDSADINAIKKFSKIGMVDGVTTNPSIIAKSGEILERLLPKYVELLRAQSVQK